MCTRCLVGVRVGWYLTQWAAKVPEKGKSMYSNLLCQGSGKTYNNTMLDDVAVIFAMAMHALRKKKDVKEFYKSQGSNYDGFRETLLPSRNTLLQYCLPWHTAPKTWLSVGCGTARDIEYVVGHLKQCNTRLYLLDLSPDLLKMAQARVVQLGLQEQVTFLEGDACPLYLGKGDNSHLKCFDAEGNDVSAIEGKRLPLAESFDIVTCSYCLTMIPPWEDAIDAMVRCLKKGGTLALIDFTMRSDCPDNWMQKINQWWFSNDGVYFNQAHTERLRSHPQLQTQWFYEEENRVPYTPMYATTYLWTGYKK